MPANYVLLRETTLNASAASVTFSSIPQTGYTDLKVVLSTRTTDTTVNDSSAIALQFNGDTGSNYTRRSLYGDGGAAGSSSATTTSMRIGFTTTNGDTANTFGNAEFYVPNYTSSNQKSVSADAVTEANVAQYIYASLNAGLWTGTAAISSITILAPSFSFLAGSSISLYGIAAFGTTPTVVPHASGGDIVTNDGTYWYHAFLASGTFIPNKALSCDVLVVAGGGGGGGDSAGGGGAGGLVAFTSQALTTTSYNVTVGAGGSGGTGQARGVTGSDSQFGALTLVKGGGGGSASGGAGNANWYGLNGGSGGGATGDTNAYIGLGTSGQGNDGAKATAGGNGGGGGKGTTGFTGYAAGSGAVGGNGGTGVNTYSSWASATGTGANSGYYAGGGGGGGYTQAPPLNAASTGGLGGGGNGGNYSNNNAARVSPTAGVVNTGGGGGGDGWFGQAGKAGGSGIIIVRYPMA